MSAIKLALDKFFIKPFPKEYEIIANWQLLSEDFKDEGKLIIRVIPEIEDDVMELITNNKVKERRVTEIDDYIT